MFLVPVLLPTPLELNGMFMLRTPPVGKNSLSRTILLTDRGSVSRGLADRKREKGLPKDY